METPGTMNRYIGQFTKLKPTHNEKDDSNITISLFDNQRVDGHCPQSNHPEEYHDGHAM